MNQFALGAFLIFNPQNLEMGTISFSLSPVAKVGKIAQEIKWPCRKIESSPGRLTQRTKGLKEDLFSYRVCMGKLIQKFNISSFEKVRLSKLSIEKVK